MPHRKQLRTGQVLYFHYQPPLTNLDVVAPSRKLAAPFSGARPYMCSPYYYWWAFLRLNDDYLECCAQGGEGKLAHLYQAFGDVRDDDFMSWWMNGGRLLFSEPSEQSIVLMHEAPPQRYQEGRLLISVPLDVPEDRVLAEIESALGLRRSDEDRERMLHSQARYNPSRTVKLQSLYRQLEIYKGKREDPSRDYWDLAVLCKMAHKDDKRYDNRSLNTQVSRYLATARKVVENVAKGRFPEDIDAQSEPDLFG
jgi:hypothetical protein